MTKVSGDPRQTKRFVVRGYKAAPDQHAASIAAKIAETLRLLPGYRWQIHRRSLDARDKGRIMYAWQFLYELKVAVDYALLQKFAKRAHLTLDEVEDLLPRVSPGTTGETYRGRPVVVGSGPAGLFAAYTLAEAGFKPILLERGADVDRRADRVSAYWAGGPIDPETNVQFGEGGAGTFSDGKLTSRSKSPHAARVIELFSRYGANEDILWMQKPHIGTDVLRDVVKAMREAIRSYGGEVYFSAKMVGLVDDRGEALDLERPGTRLGGIRVQARSSDFPYGDTIQTDLLVLAIGHSARDSYRMLRDAGLEMQCKPFAIGLRIEHKQHDINLAQYGEEAISCYGEPAVGEALSPAEYQLSHQVAETGRGIYTFCMCPGGQVVASASDVGQVVTNGMSERSRSLENANSAVLCTVTPADFGETIEEALGFQESLERRAWLLGQGLDPNTDILPDDAAVRPAIAPVQLVSDFLQGAPSTDYGEIRPSYTPATRLTDLGTLFSEEVSASLRLGLIGLGQKLPAFRMEDAILTGVESRSSAAIRILRDRDTLTATRLDTLYPIGEGAGYAGGIVSSAIDGIRAAEAIIARYTPKS